MAIAGRAASTTKVMSQPVMNANTNPEVNVATGIIKVPIFYPTPYWKEIVSAANFDANSV